MANYVTLTSDKKKRTAYTLCLFGGLFGLHYFYVGKTFTGILYNKAWRMILASVTENIGYDLIVRRYDFIPYTKTDFYGVRRAFFHRLDILQAEPESLDNTGAPSS